MKKKLDIYIKENFVKSEKSFLPFKNAFKRCKNIVFEECVFDDDIDNFVKDNKNENIFNSLLFKYIDERHLKDSDVYNKVHIDRRLFSKIRNNHKYHPSKETVILLGLALELNEDEFILLLESASYSLPMNNYYDLIIRFCFINKIYDLIEVNDLLDLYGCKLFSY